MNVIVFGASGGTGTELVRAALAAGHSVTAFVRDRTRLKVIDPQLRAVEGDVMRGETVVAALPGHQAVLCALGTTPDDGARRQPDVPVCSRGTQNILAAMAKSGCTRIVVESSVSVGESFVTGRLWGGLLAHAVLHAAMVDKEIQEAAVRASATTWTIVRPPRLTYGPRRGAVRAGEGLRWSVLSTLPRADVAEFMVAVLDSKAWFHRAVTVA